jgi:hypothetical protein
MGILSTLTRSADTIYAIRFLRLLTTRWTSTGAYKLGLIDDKGKHIRSPQNSNERSKYNIFHRLVFNIKRLLNKIPFGRTTIASYLAALYLIKEHTGLSDKKIVEIMEEISGEKIDLSNLNESTWYVTEDQKLKSGNYVLNHDIALRSTGQILALSQSNVIVENQMEPVGQILGVNVYKAHHCKTQQPIYITQHDITRQ